MWFKHRAWIPVAWVLCVVNIGATWFAAAPGEPLHATIHSLLAVVFGVGAQRLAARQQAIASRGGEAEFPADLTAMRELTALRQAQAETLNRVEQAVEQMAVELERVGEGQRFLTKVMADPARRPPPNEEP